MAYFTEPSYINNIKNGSVSGATTVELLMPSVMTLTMAWNPDTTTGPMPDINVRKAFAYGVDFATIVDTLGEGLYPAANSVIPADSWAYYDAGTYTYDPEKAKEYLAEAGYGPDNPLTLIFAAEESAFVKALAEAMQADLQQIGINLDLSNIGPMSAILPVVLANEHDVSLRSPYNGVGTDPSCSIDGMNPSDMNLHFAMAEPEMSALFLTALSSRDQDERKVAFREFQQKLYDDCLAIPLYQEMQYYGVLDAHASAQDAIFAGCYINARKLAD